MTKLLNGVKGAGFGGGEKGLIMGVAVGIFVFETDLLHFAQQGSSRFVYKIQKTFPVCSYFGEGSAIISLQISKNCVIMCTL